MAALELILVLFAVVAALRLLADRLRVTAAGGKPFPGRDLILFLTFSVIFVTLVLQGLTLKPVIRALGLKPDAESDAEERQARSRVTEAGLAKLEKMPHASPIEEVVRKGLRAKYEHVWHRLSALARGGHHEKDEKRTEAYRRYRLGMIGAERSELLRLRDTDVISDEVMRRIQRDLDLEQVLLESPQSALTGLEKPDAENT